MNDLSTNYLTYDGKGITPGLRVWSPYPYQWGNVDASNWTRGTLTGPGGEYFDGWYTVTMDNGRNELLNGTRMSSVQLDPRGPADPKANCHVAEVRYLATVNIPGYLPQDDDPPLFETAAAAWGYLADKRREAEEAEDGQEDYSSTVGDLDAHEAAGTEEGSVHGCTPGYDGRHDLGIAYTVTKVTVTEGDE